MENPKCFIEIKSDDDLVQKLQAQIEKTILLNMWISKATALLSRYMKALDELDKETDSFQRGLKIESCESYFMSSIILFHRCFVSQPTMYLQIEQVTTEQDVRDTYKELLKLRNDEFIHWKGVRSNIQVRYSFEAVTPKQVNFAQDIQGQFTDKVGPGFDTSPFMKLYNSTAEYIEGRRLAILQKLREHLQKPEVFNKSQFLNENGESVIRTE